MPFCRASFLLSPGQQPPGAAYKRLVGYVEQKDILLATLTPRYCTWSAQIFLLLGGTLTNRWRTRYEISFSVATRLEALKTFKKAHMAITAPLVL